MPAAAISFTPRQLAMLPGSPLDRRVTRLKTLFPALAGLTVVAIVIMTLAPSDELSFVLSRDRIATSPERLRAEGSAYRGLDAKGRPFVVRAAEAVQQTSATPIVELKRLSAEMKLEAGTASITAPSGRLLLDLDQVEMDGPVKAAQAAYRVDSGTVTLDLKQNRTFSDVPLTGALPIGKFRAGGMRADVTGQTVTLIGGVHLNVPRASGN